jgi:hypothetical protein
MAFQIRSILIMLKNVIGYFLIDLFFGYDIILQ